MVRLFSFDIFSPFYFVLFVLIRIWVMSGHHEGSMYKELNVPSLLLRLLSVAGDLSGAISSVTDFGCHHYLQL